MYETCAEYATYILEYLIQCVVHSKRMLNEELVLEYLTHCRLYRETERGDEVVYNVVYRLFCV